MQGAPFDAGAEKKDKTHPAPDQMLYYCRYIVKADMGLKSLTTTYDISTTPTLRKMYMQRNRSSLRNEKCIRPTMALHASTSYENPTNLLNPQKAA